ncbi:hypothetical protein ACVMHZ_000935 [Bradyrhizobium liaoningense]
MKALWVEGRALVEGRAAFPKGRIITMAERYQDRPFPSDDYGRGGDQHGKAENDPLAELARLIGQTDPFAGQGRPTARPQATPPRSYHPDDYRQDDDQQDYAEQAPPPPGPPSWMRRANVQPAPAPEPDYPVSVSPVHPLHRYSAKPAVPEPDVHQAQAYQDGSYQDQAYQGQAYQQHGQAYQDQAEQESHAQTDPSRYDDALYGRLETGEQDYQRDPAYPDDPYAFQSDYPDDAEIEEPKKRRGGMMTVAAILALAVVGTGAAFAYKTYMGTPRSGEPPIIKADNTPTKIVPAPTDSSAKVPDRMASGDGTEKIVPREEAPVDVNAKAGGPRVVFPPMNQNANPPSVASVSPSAVPVAQHGTGPKQRDVAEQFAAPDPDRRRKGRPDRRHRTAIGRRQADDRRTQACCRARCDDGAAQFADLGKCQPQPAPFALAAVGTDGRACAPDGCHQPDANRPRQQRWRLHRAGVFAAKRRQRRGVLPSASEQVRQRARLPFAGDQAGRSDRQGQGDRLSRLRGSLRFGRGGDAGLQQPEGCRPVRLLHPEELTAVSLTPSRGRVNRPL